MISKRLLKTFGAAIAVIVFSFSQTPAVAQTTKAPTAEQVSKAPVASPQAKRTAAEIKLNPRYRELREGQSPNWFSKAIENVGKLFERLFGRPSGDVNAPNLSGLGFFGNVLVYLFWGLLAVGVALFLYFVLRHFKWQASLAKRTKAVLDEDEPDRSLDEWLVLADQFESEGKYREAVRCLFLACLLKFDERGVAYFDRGQTNWEHLARIEASPKLPPGIDFRQPTRDFDRIWYGYRVDGVFDVARFRATYQSLLEGLRQGMAA